MHYLEKLISGSESGTDEAQIEILNGEISDKESAIEDTKQKLEDAQAEKDKQYASMKKRIQYLYENGGSNAWAQMILESGSITDMFDKPSILKKCISMTAMSCRR